jgi:hypothetical protein
VRSFSVRRSWPRGRASGVAPRKPAGWTRLLRERTSSSMSETKTYAGGCHCGKVRYEVELDLQKPVISCNCSICNRVGSLLTFVPATSFKLLSGEETLTDYQFNKHVIHHVFCRVCGIKSFARGKGRDGSDTVAINARCLDGVDIATLNVMAYDGKSK